MNGQIMSTHRDWNEDYYYREINPEIMTSLINGIFGDNETVTEEEMLNFFNEFIPLFQIRNPRRTYYRFAEEDFENNGRPITKIRATHLITFLLNGSGLVREFSVEFENAEALARLVHTGKTTPSIAYSIVNSLTNKHNPHLDNKIFGKFGEAIKSRKKRNKRKGKKGKKSKKG